MAILTLQQLSDIQVQSTDTPEKQTNNPLAFPVQNYWRKFEHCDNWVAKLLLTIRSINYILLTLPVLRTSILVFKYAHN